MSISFSTEHSVHTKYLTDAQSVRILFHTYCDFFTSQFKVWKQTTVKIHRSSNHRHERYSFTL